ncbi:MAG: oligosaccharide flippase family protein [Patescibacteria group bacterium]|jgi:O-antigen/teichoic acid export membrane protein
MSKFRQFSRQLGLIGFLQILTKIRALFVLPLITKVLGTTDYGLWMQFTVTIEFIFPLASLGLTGALTRFFAAEKEKEKIREGFYTIFFVILGLCVVLSTIIHFGSHFLAKSFFDNNIRIVQLLSITLIFHCLNTLQLSYFRTFKQTNKYSFFFLLENYGGLGIILFLVLSGYGIFEVLVSLMLVKAILFSIIFVIIAREIGFAFPHFRNMRHFLHFSLPSIPSNISGWVLQLSDRYVIAFFLGVVAVGVYSPAYTLGSLVAILAAPFAFILTPYLSESYDRNNLAEVKQYLFYSLKYFLILAIPSVFGLALLSKPLLTALSNADIAEKAYVITPFVAVATLLYGLIIILSEVVGLVKKTIIIAKGWVIGAVLNIGLNLIIIPYLGIFGAALTTFFSYSVVFVFLFLKSRRLIQYRFDMKSVIKSIAISTVFFPIIMLLQPNTLLSIFSSVILCFVVYCVAAYFFGVVNKNEVEFLRRIVIKK